ncbi:MAG: hypothetical protein COU06_00335 [Candidatus Harrisonbacteria bacterium CG10_big_fil_rev_8_21_14_0_10_38_8]|uniref:Uncharacterized protein n=1 Tax=Candidatus Harrisonbacteria bacterium CG10_big_fil_rev_8_21_14_0_10_38_8 TaxID=1974582 RepID=A0A2M6WKU6_9BACT|nr:MAG: hypothetical protein COU06_00335 [Candidatus Harrisonbacteria bacterium CG10_big_fil_rev_8_21_14_0_10_38_8]
MHSKEKKDAIAIIFILAIIISLASLIIASLRYVNTDYSLLLHVDNYREIEIFGTPGHLLMMIIFSSVLIFTNYILAYYLKGREQILSFILATTSLFLSVLLFISLFVIVLSN